MSAGLTELQVLHLDHNQLQHLYGHEFHGLVNLRRLHLDHNQLVSIHQDTFKRLKRLTQLRLDANLLISFPIWELSSNPALSSLTLANNWWRCDCDFVRKFRMFIDGKAEGIVEDAKMITCTSSDSDADDQGGGGGLREECSGILKGFQFERTFGSDIAPLVIGVTVLSVVVVLAIAALYKMREPLLILLHDKYGIRICRLPAKRGGGGGQDEENLFDALVIYSIKDEKLVLDEFVKPLEPSYKLCLHHRDLSGIYTSEAFKSAQAASDWQIVVLSQGLLATEWDYVKDLILPDCLVVLADDINLRADDQKLKTFLKSARKVVRWKDDGFWRKVRYYLPDPTKIRTKEGGAELDVSGVWTFTTSAEENSANTTAASTAKLLSSSPMTSDILHYGNGLGAANANTGATSMLSMLQQSSFPAPPVRKQPHQCSMHYLAGAPSSPPSQPATRSCGTNAIHQRSVSAIVSKANSFNHARSSSYAAHIAPRFTDATPSRPPPPPPPQKSGNWSSGVVHENGPAPVYDTTSFMYRLQQSAAANAAAAAGHSPKRPSSPPSSSLAMTPLRANNLHISHHQRSTSLLDPNATGVGVGRYAKHGRSVSNLSPMNAAIATPRLLKSAAPVVRTSSMMNCRPGMALHKSASNLLYEPRPQPQGASSSAMPQHHKSFSSLVPNEAMAVASAMPAAAIGRPVHFRSKSTPHEGFVL